MTRGTEWVGGVYPTTFIGRGNDALRDWMGGEGRTVIVNRRGTGGARRLSGLLRGGVEGCVGGGRTTGIADTGGMRPMRLQDWGAHGPGGCRIGGHRASEVVGPTDIESKRQAREAICHQVPEVRTGCWAAGWSAEG